jgi:flagellar hook-associated protein 3 FlgL
MFFRITNNLMLLQALYQLAKQSRNLGHLQEQAASGRKILRASDDPTGMMMSLRLLGQLNRFEQYKKNIDFGLRWLNFNEAVLNDLEENITKAMEVAVSQASDTANADTRRASAVFIRGLKQTILQLSNSSFEGRYLFSGLSGKEAYDEAGNFLGDRGIFQIGIGEGILVRINLVGPEVFGEGEDNLIKVLDEMANVLEGNDLEGIRQMLNKLQINLNRVIEARSKIGALSSQLEAYKSILEDRTIRVNSSLSELVDADLAQVITELSSRQLAYQATLLAVKRLFDETLISLLR